MFFLWHHRKDNIKQDIQCVHDVVLLVVAQLGLITSKTYDLVATLIEIFPCCKRQDGNSFSLLNFVFEVILEAERGTH
jgi:hypothetical protein